METNPYSPPEARVADASAHPDSTRLTKPFWWLRLNFYVLVGSFLVMILGQTVPLSQEVIGNIVAWTAIIFFLPSLIAFYVFLGILASRLKRSVIVWCGLTMLTSPFGYPVAFLAMKRRVRDATSLARHSPMTAR
jgi:hypothetical protein